MKRYNSSVETSACGFEGRRDWFSRFLVGIMGLWIEAGVEEDLALEIGSCVLISCFFCGTGVFSKKRDEGMPKSDSKKNNLLEVS
jgi:hypothetical protein